MPVIGSFHGKYWRARANAPVAGGSGRNVYPVWQASVIVGMFAWCEAIAPIWDQLRWSWRLAKRLWWWRDPAQRARLEAWIARLDTLTPEQSAIVERVVVSLQRPEWASAREGVRRCATSPKFHQPEQWIEYSRAIKADGGQAQNVFRHIKVVHELKAAHPDLSNPEAHLLTELAYQGMSAAGRPDRQIVEHQKVVTH